MKRNLFGLIVALILVFASSISLADINTGIPCVNDAECDIYDSYYCNLTEGFCFSPEEETVEETTTDTTAETTTTTETAVTQADLTALESSISNLETKIDQLQQTVNSVQVNLNNEQSKINQLSRGLAALEDKTEQAASGAQTVSTGLAGLQEEVDTTQTEVEVIEEELEEEKSFTQLLKLLFFLAVLGIVAVVIIYFLKNKKKKVHPHVRNFITNHIQAGKKFSHIKEAMTGAGWKEPEIVHAYKGTMRHNYRQYKKGKPVSKPPTDKTKVISLLVVSVLLIFGIFFLLSGTVGKAFFVERFQNVSSGEIIDVVRCTPPQILTPDGDACCTDSNENSLCDSSERYVEEMGDSCSDNLQCSGNQLCIDFQCQVLADLYEGSSICEKYCDFYSVNVNANGETYNYRPGLGSYTCAGAIEWKVMTEMPSHCEGEQAIIPFRIIKKDQGRVLSEEVITLRQRETGTVEHPNLDCSLELTVSRVFELCE